jgi:hypothetical protein
MEFKLVKIPRKRRLSPEDAFFYDGNVERERRSKIRYVRDRDLRSEIINK